MTSAATSGSVKGARLARAEWSPALKRMVASRSERIGRNVARSSSIVSPADRHSAANTSKPCVNGVKVPLSTRRWVSHVPISAPPSTTTRLTPSRRQKSGTAIHAAFARSRVRAFRVLAADAI